MLGGAELRRHAGGGEELHAMALAVVEGERRALESEPPHLGQDHGGVHAAGEEDHRTLRHARKGNQRRYAARLAVPDGYHDPVLQAALRLLLAVSVLTAPPLLGRAPTPAASVGECTRGPQGALDDGAPDAAADCGADSRRASCCGEGCTCDPGSCPCAVEAPSNPAPAPIPAPPPAPRAADGAFALAPADLPSWMSPAEPSSPAHRATASSRRVDRLACGHRGVRLQAGTRTT